MQSREPICPLCGDESCADIKTYPGNGEESLLNIDRIAECEECGMVFASPIPSQEKLDEYYSEGLYWSKQAVATNAMHIHNMSQAIARAKVCRQWIAMLPERIIDIGSGYGWLAEGLIREFGASLDSHYCFIEPDDKAANEILLRVKRIRPTRVNDYYRLRLRFSIYESNFRACGESVGIFIFSVWKNEKWSLFILRSP